jgi:ribosomal protein L37E
MSHDFATAKRVPATSSGVRRFVYCSLTVLGLACVGAWLISSVYSIEVAFCDPKLDAAKSTLSASGYGNHWLRDTSIWSCNVSDGSVRITWSRLMFGRPRIRVERVTPCLRAFPAPSFGISDYAGSRSGSIALPLLGSALPICGLALVVRPRKKPARNALCQRCGYNLRALTSGRCPECGMPIPRRVDNANAAISGPTEEPTADG